MNIIILGAGQVGGTLAENLVRESNDVTIVDLSEERLRLLQHRLDIRTVQGFASYPSILIQAGIENADMLIAVTSSDETNLVACQVAYRLFNTPLKLARIRSSYYVEYGESLFSAEAFSVDFCISPENLVTQQVARLIEVPGALQVLDFADSLVRLIAIRSEFGGILVGKTLKSLKECIPAFSARVIAIYRGARSIPLTPSTVIDIEDELFIIAPADQMTDVMSSMRKIEQPCKNVMIAGGGHIGERLAMCLEKKYNVKVIEQNIGRCHYLAQVLEETTVLEGNTTDKDLLLNENIDYIDVFIAVTNNDEVNIMSCIQAKRMGAKKVMALITRQEYVDLIESTDIDIAISPQQATIGSILAQIRRGDIVNVHSLRRGAAEAIEVVAHGDEETSNVVGRSLTALNLPKGVTIGAIVRDKQVILPDPSSVIQANDHIIIFVIDKKYIREIERLFVVNLTYG